MKAFLISLWAVLLTVVVAQDPWVNLNKFLEGVLFQFDYSAPEYDEIGWYCIKPEPGCTEMPEAVKSIKVLNGGSSLGEMLETGNFRIQKLRCTDFNILPDTEVSIGSSKNGWIDNIVDIKMQGVDVKCDVEVDYKNVRCESWWDASCQLVFGIVLGTENQVPIQVVPTTDRSQAIGISLTNKFQFVETTPPGLPTHYQPREYEITDCDLKLNGNTLEFRGEGGWTSVILEIVVNLLPGVFEAVGCGIIQQFGKLDDGSPGFLGIAWDALVDSMVDVAQQKPPFTSPSEAEDFFISQGPPEDIEDFSDSFTYNVLSVIINDVLGSNTTETDRLVINDLVDRITENTEGIINVDLSESDVTLGDLDGNNVAIGNTVGTIDNANTFTGLSVLKNPDKKYKHTLENKFDLDQLGLGLDTTMVIDAKDFISREPGFPNQLLEVQLNATLRTLDAHAVVTALMATNFSALERVYVGNVLDYYTEEAGNLEQSVACLGQALYQFNVTDFELEYTDFYIDLKGVVDQGMDQVITELNATVVDMFDDLVTKLVPSITRGQIENMNAVSRSALDSVYDNGGVSDYCPNAYDGNRTTEISVLDWEGSVALNLQDALDKTLSLVDDKALGINRIVQILTSRLQGELEVVPAIKPGEVFIGNVVAQSASVDNRLSSIKIDNLRLGHLDSFHVLDLLNPLSPSRVRNRFILGGNPEEEPNSEDAFRMSMDITVSTGGAFGIDESGEERIWTLEVEFFGLDTSIDLDLEVDINRFYPLRFGELTDPACILGSLRSFGVAEFNGTHEQTAVKLTCDGCGLGSKLLTEEAIAKTTFITNAAFAIMRESLSSDDAVAAANRVIQDYANMCGQPRDIYDLFNFTTLAPTEPVPDVGLLFLGYTNGIAYSIVILFFGTACLRRKKVSDQKRLMQMLDDEDDDESEGPFNSGSYRMQDEPMAENEFSNLSTLRSVQKLKPKGSETSDGDNSVLTSSMDIGRFGPSMFFDPNVPSWFKLFLPLIILGTLVMFFTANLDIGGSVSVVATLETGQEVDLGSLFDFTLTGSINDMWNADTPALALLVAAASGCWPYVKLILTLLAFFLPPRVISVSTRGTLLSVLDTLGRWSIVDQFLMAILLIVFAIHVEVPAPANKDWMFADLLPDNFLTVDVSIVPNYGLYGFLVAAAISIGIGHMVSHYHDKIVHSAWTSAHDPEDSVAQKKAHSVANRKEPLRRHAFERHLDDRTRRRLAGRAAGIGDDSSIFLRGYKIRYSQLTGLIVLFAFNFTLIALVAAYMLKSFGFYLRGVGGAAIGWIEPGRNELELSLLDAAVGITKGARDDGQRLGLLFIQVTFVLFAIVVPLTRLVLYAVLWFVPVSFNDQSRIFMIAKGLKSWSGLDVFVAAVVAGYFNIEQFAEFMVKPYCSQIDAYLRDYGVASGLVTSKEATCFRVEAFITPMFAVPVVAILLMGLLMRFVHSSCETALEDREALIKGCHSPYKTHPKSGIPKRQLRTFCCKLRDLSLIRLGLVKPILLLGRDKDERRDSDEMTQRSYPWSDRLGNEDSFRDHKPTFGSPKQRLGNFGSFKPQVTQDGSPALGTNTTNPLFAPVEDFV